MRVLRSFFGSLLLVWLFKSSNFIYIFRQSAIFFFISFRFVLVFFVYYFFFFFCFFYTLFKALVIYSLIFQTFTHARKDTHTHTWRAQNTAEDESNNNKIEKKHFCFFCFFRSLFFVAAAAAASGDDGLCCTLSECVWVSCYTMALLWILCNLYRCWWYFFFTLYS